MKKVLFLAGLLICAAPSLFAVNEVIVEPATVQEVPPDRYTVSAPVFNKTDKPREVTVRAQIAFFDRVSPEGDKPVQVLRKDMTVVLKAHERRKIRVRLIDEGTVPKERVRLETRMRLRRQRLWHY